MKIITYKSIALLFFMTGFIFVNAQDEKAILMDVLVAKTPIDNDLRELCDEIGGRVTGSANNNRAVEWGLKKFEDAGVKAWTESFTMPSLWLENITRANITGDINFEPNLVAKYQTAPGNYSGNLISIGMGSKEEIEKNIDLIRNNFVLVESELCLDINGLFAEYVHAAEVEERLKNTGIKGIVFMASRPNGLLYRFITSSGIDNELAQFVMSREDSKRCKRALFENLNLEINIVVDAEIGGAFTSHNVIAEIKGTEKPEEIILIGAHLDSWALGTGANDNGCNAVMMIDIARQMKALNIQPKRTIRFALWNGEEQGYFGSWAYTKSHNMDQHKLAISIDIGSGEIVGFFTNGRADLTETLDNMLAPINQDSSLTSINIPIIGTDNFDFILQGVPNLVGAHKPASYGVNYHAASDTYDKVNFTSLKKNAALISYLLLTAANDDSQLAELPRMTREEINLMFTKHETEFSMRMFNVWEPWKSGQRGRK